MRKTKEVEGEKRMGKQTAMNKKQMRQKGLRREVHLTPQVSNRSPQSKLWHLSICAINLPLCEWPWHTALQTRGRITHRVCSLTVQVWSDCHKYPCVSHWSWKHLWCTCTLVRLRLCSAAHVNKAWKCYTFSLVSKFHKKIKIEPCFSLFEAKGTS